jgi:GntR family transcriptional repressor for pyruvate dehydrogenase complex
MSGDAESPKLSPARRTEKISESVARSIVRDAAQLKPGATLPSEAVMLEAYGVSRGSLREALRILEVQGLVSIRPGPGGGPVLHGPNVDSMAQMQSLHFHLMRARHFELVAARVIVEPQIARLAAERTDRDALSPLKRFLVADHHDVVIDEDYVNAGVGFHRVVCTLSGNPVLDMIASSLNQIVLTRLQGAHLSAQQMEAIVCDHVAIAEAIFAGNGPLAELLMSDHMNQYAGGVAEVNGMALNEIVDWR